jgi:putative sigma-54 modulation protein
MQVQYSFKHMKASQALKSYIEDRLHAIINRYVTKLVDTKVIFSVEKKQHIASCIVRGGDGFSIQVDHVDQDMYKTVDHMLDKLKSQLKRKKEKLKDHRPIPIEVEEEPEQEQD